MARSFPTKKQILDFINASPNKVGKREIARAFNIKSADRIRLKELLRDLSDEGALQKGAGKSVRSADTPPPVAVITVTGIDDQGDLVCALADGGEDQPFKITLFVRGGKKGRGDIGVGDRLLAKLTQLKARHYSAKVLKKLERRALQFVGVYRKAGPDLGLVRSLERKSNREFVAEPDDKVKDGDIVIVEAAEGPRYAPSRVRVRRVIGHEADARSISLIAVHAHGIPLDFPDTAEKEAHAAHNPAPKERTDLTHLRLITIDPDDARDFDDAVHAEPDPDPGNKGGWIVTVAIADVAHFVRPGSALDLEARKRGNSCYFPDRVVPMLPERLSNTLCSLRPDEIRSALGVRMKFARTGRKLSHEFFRGLIRSHARLTYSQAQDAIDGKPDKTTKPLLNAILKPLWAAYGTLARGRSRRGPLELEMPEYRIELTQDGRVARITAKTPLESHRLIEEFMIQANVCAAETLEKRSAGLLFRIHEAPSEDKLEALRDVLQSVGLAMSKGEVLKPSLFNGLLKQVKGTEYEKMIHEMVLRTQMQAIYSTENLGHFGLNLRRYTHFTSPIRRYSDLVVHRGLIHGLGLGPDGLNEGEIATLKETAQHISFCERRAMAAERETTDRYLAAFLQDRVGATFEGRIAGLSRFGMFVEFGDMAADGLVPLRSLFDDRYQLRDAGDALVGLRHGGLYRLGQDVEVRLVEADRLTGALRLELLTPPVFEGGKPGKRRAPAKRKSGTRPRRRR